MFWKLQQAASQSWHSCCHSCLLNYLNDEAEMMLLIAIKSHKETILSFKNAI